MQHTMMDFPLVLPSVLDRAQEFFGDIDLVSHLPDHSLHRYTYGDLHSRATRLAEALIRLGLHKGDRVGTLMWNHYCHLESYFGIPAAGGVLHTLNLRLHPRDLSYILRHAGDRFLIVDDLLLPLVQKVDHDIPAQRIIVVRWKDENIPSGYSDFESLLSRSTGDFRRPRIEESDPLGMCYTSGTTGEPKGVVYSHRSQLLHSMTECLPDVLGLSQRDTVLAVVPMFHVNAWGLPFSCAMVGCRQVFPGPHLDPVSLLDLFEQEGVTFAAGVPTVWFGILEQLKASAGRWKLRRGLRTVVGGTAMPESTIREFDSFGIRVIHAWGMTEMSPVGSVSTLRSTLENASEDQRYKERARQGVPVPFVEIRAQNEEGLVPWNDESMGELQVRGPWVAARYHNRPEAKGNWTDDGWLKTGDVVTINPHGSLRIVDRSKDLIKSGGEWISSVDLENALVSHPDVNEAAVIAVPDPRWQERPLAVIVAVQGKRLDIQELRQYLLQSFAPWQIPDEFRFVDGIPKTSTGKYQKRALREEFAKGRKQNGQSDP